jgi:hypothetical protein
MSDDHERRTAEVALSEGLHALALRLLDDRTATHIVRRISASRQRRKRHNCD